MFHLRRSHDVSSTSMETTAFSAASKATRQLVEHGDRDFRGCFALAIANSDGDTLLAEGP